MTNIVYVQFQRHQNLYIECSVHILDKNCEHIFDYEDFEEMMEDWKSDEVINRLKQFEVLGDFEESLRRQKGFYYRSKDILSEFIKIDPKELNEMSIYNK